MTIIPKILDPVQGLIDYTLAVKPYHTKIIEVLEEYIHTDYIYVTMTDRLDICVNLGYPNLNTIFSYNIIGVDFSTNSVKIAGKVSNFINSGQRVSIEFSSQNDGFYYVDNIVFNQLENISNVFFTTELPSDIADGKLVNSVIQYCPFKDDKSTNVLEIPPIICDDGYGNIYDSFIETVFGINLSNNEITISGDHTLELSNTTTVQLVNELLYDEINQTGDIVGTFHIDSFNFNGTSTIIKVIEDISTFPTFNINDSYKLLITYLGYDEVIRCNLDDPNSSETLFVTMEEKLDFEISLDYSNEFTVYNMENSNDSRYDSFGLGYIISQTTPNVPETLVEPLNPNVFDLWYDLNVGVLKQWHNFNWVSIKHVYWYQEDPVNNQNVTYYKLIKNKFEDTGWIEVNPLLNDSLSPGYDQEPFNLIKHNYYHDGVQIQLDTNINGMFLYGGDFSPLLIHNLTVQAYDNNNLIGNIHHATYKIDSYGTNYITLSSAAGDLTDIFVLGVNFKIEDPTLINKSFNVSSSIYNGINTIVTLFENISHNTFNHTIIGTIPALFYVQPNTFNNLSTIDGVSTLFILDAPMNPNIQSIEYFYNGPLHLNVDMFPNSGLNIELDDSMFSNELTTTSSGTSSGDEMETTITDEISWSWGNITDWFQYYIIAFPSVNEILIAGNATTDIQIGQQFRIIGNTPNAGIYSVLSTFFDGVNTTITINEIVDTLELGGYIEPVDILPIRIILEDTISVSAIEETLGGLLDTSGNIIESPDFKYFDIGGYDFPYDPNNIN